MVLSKEEMLVKLAGFGWLNSKGRVFFLEFFYLEGACLVKVDVVVEGLLDLIDLLQGWGKISIVLLPYYNCQSLILRSQTL